MRTATEIALDLRDDMRRKRATLRIVSCAPNRIEILQAPEAEEFGEEPVQLVEMQRYEYRLEDCPRTLHLRETSAIRRSRLGLEIGDTGVVEPGQFTGLLPIVLEDEQGNATAAAAVEVRSRKLEYRSEYRAMIEDIAKKSTDLLVDVRAPAQVRLLPDPARDPESLQQRYAFLASLIDSAEFRDAVSRVLATPHRKMEQVSERRPSARPARIRRAGLRQLASDASRVPLREDHPLSVRMQQLGIEPFSLPRQLVGEYFVDSVDTAENRFVKYALRDFDSYLSRMLVVAQKLNSPADKRLRSELRRLRLRLGEILADDLFKEVSELVGVPLASPVLQRREGYREILQAWLRFDLAARLVWSGGDDVFGAGKKDTSTLYEYWLYFGLADLACSLTGQKLREAADLVVKDGNDFRLRLRSGRESQIDGVCQSSPEVMMRFSYNRTFRGGSDPQSAGSWTRTFRPDYTFTFWARGSTLSDAEAAGEVVHLHFDAKYRIESLIEAFGPEATDLEAEEAEERGGTYKRADLFKMHAYKDAIRRSEGAYVLYPGSRGARWSQYAEIVPGLGAFPVRPAASGHADGIEAVRSFIAEVVRHLAERGFSGAS